VRFTDSSMEMMETLNSTNYSYQKPFKDN